MKNKYFISVFAQKSILPVINSALEDKINSEDLTGNIHVINVEINYIDHGQNPAGDLDCRAYIKINDSSGNKIFPLSEIIKRTNVRDIENYVNNAIKTLQKHSSIAA